MMSAIDIVFWLDFASTVISLLSGIFGAISFAKGDFAKAAYLMAAAAWVKP